MDLAVVRSAAVISTINWIENSIPLDILQNLTFYQKGKKKSVEEQEERELNSTLTYLVKAKF